MQHFLKQFKIPWKHNNLRTKLRPHHTHKSFQNIPLRIIFLLLLPSAGIMYSYHGILFEIIPNMQILQTDVHS